MKQYLFYVCLCVLFDYKIIIVVTTNSVITIVVIISIIMKLLFLSFYFSFLS